MKTTRFSTVLILIAAGLMALPSCKKDEPTTPNGGGSGGSGGFSLNCTDASHNGTLTEGQTASGVTIEVPYSDGGGDTHNGQTVASTGVTGLTANLASGTFADGDGTLTYIISGTPTGSGDAFFALDIGGQSCTISRTVLTIEMGSISSLNCQGAVNSGNLIAEQAATGVFSQIPYSGGNGGPHTGQIAFSTGVTGLTATVGAGNFADGNGTLTYIITGTPSTFGIASFTLDIGGQICIMSRSVGSNDGGSIFNPNLNYSSITDQDGNTYATIVIGTQEWMAENLRTTTYANGDPIPEVMSAGQWQNLNTGAWAHYDSDSQLEIPYGKLYNWYAVNDDRNVCPSGWHVPTDAEWTVLTSYLGGQSGAGGKMKSVGTEYWQNPNAGSTNESGFSALPGGYRYFTGSFLNAGYFGYWWSSSDYNDTYAWYRYLDYGDDYAYKGTSHKKGGQSVRCLRD